MTLPQLIEVCTDAKIPPFDRKKSSDLNKVIKNIRNLIHPGRRIAANIPCINKFEYDLLNLFL